MRSFLIFLITVIVTDFSITEFSRLSTLFLKKINLKKFYEKLSQNLYMMGQNVIY